MSIHVTDFKWEKGKNDVQYIELLEKTLKNEQVITANAVAKIRELTEKNKEMYSKGYNQGTIDRAEEIQKAREYGYAKGIDEFAKKLKTEILEEIYDVSERQRNYELGSDMSITYSHIMGTLRDVYHRIIDKTVERLKEGADHE